MLVWPFALHILLCVLVSGLQR